jgi:conjugative transfer region lipoprotein (TIGR03751 family)
MMNNFIPAILISFILILSGCSGNRDFILPQDGPTTKEIYDRHLSGSSDVPAAGSGDKGDVAITLGVIKSRFREKAGNETGLSDYTRTAKNEITQIFPRLKNKLLVMYVFPHLSKKERSPVPGYSTAFSLFEKVEFALPGEKEEGY